MKRLILPAILLVAAGFAGWHFGAFDRFLMWSSASTPLSCDYNGKTYTHGDQRMADDGCNVCTCSEHGWSCTTAACTASADGMGRITGEASFPAGARTVRVCAINVKNGREQCSHAVPGAARFDIHVPAGSYWAYAMRTDAEQPFKAWFTEYIRCGKGETCKDRTPVTLEVGKDAMIEADPSDWDIKSAMDLLNVSPSKWEYVTHNYYASSVFHMKTRGMTAVTVFSTPYPPVQDASATPIGPAAPVSETDGIQTWTLAIPPGFQAMSVYAEGTDAEGYSTRSRPLGVVRPAEGSKVE